MRTFVSGFDKEAKEVDHFSETLSRKFGSAFQWESLMQLG